MHPGNTRTAITPRTMLLVAAGSVLAAVLLTLAVLFGTGRLGAGSSNRQAMIHGAGKQVMPFDLNRTTHVFRTTDRGGAQQVIAKDPNDQEQIALIQQHVQHEAASFSAGNFSDPARLHGADMPGLQELAAGASKIKVEYSALPNGAQIIYMTEDQSLVTALHRWFNAQLSDHGRDATGH
jgi:hypothetical protein